MPSEPSDARGDLYNTLDTWADNWTLGKLIIAGGDIPRLVAGREVDVHLLRSQSGGDTLPAFAGTARLSASRTTISIRIAPRVMTLPFLPGGLVSWEETHAARPISLSPVIDADREQARVSGTGRAGRP